MGKKGADAAPAIATSTAEEGEEEGCGLVQDHQYSNIDCDFG